MQKGKKFKSNVVTRDKDIRIYFTILQENKWRKSANECLVNQTLNHSREELEGY